MLIIEYMHLKDGFEISVICPQSVKEVKLLLGKTYMLDTCWKSH